MAQIKIEVTFNTNEETLEQALAKLGVPAGNVGALAETAAREMPDRPEALSAKDKPATSKKQTTAEPDPEPETDSASAAKDTPGAEEKPVTKTDVRAMATALTKAGKRDALKAIFKKMGAEKLSDIQEKDYPALMRELVAANA